jgi:hypothetical protein
MIRNAMTAAKVSREARRRVRVALIPLARCTAVSGSMFQTGPVAVLSTNVNVCLASQQSLHM